MSVCFYQMKPLLAQDAIHSQYHCALPPCGLCEIYPHQIILFHMHVILPNSLNEIIVPSTKEHPDETMPNPYAIKHIYIYYCVCSHYCRIYFYLSDWRNVCKRRTLLKAKIICTTKRNRAISHSLIHAQNPPQSQKRLSSGVTTPQRHRYMC